MSDFNPGDFRSGSVKCEPRGCFANIGGWNTLIYGKDVEGVTEKKSFIHIKEKNVSEFYFDKRSHRVTQNMASTTLKWSCDFVKRDIWTGFAYTSNETIRNVEFSTYKTLSECKSDIPNQIKSAQDMLDELKSMMAKEKTEYLNDPEAREFIESISAIAYATYKCGLNCKRSAGQLDLCEKLVE